MFLFILGLGFAVLLSFYFLFYITRLPSLDVGDFMWYFCNFQAVDEERAVSRGERYVCVPHLSVTRD